jgi:hypothetical protein
MIRVWTLLLALLVATAAPAQDLPKARALLEEALRALQPAPTAVPIATPEALDLAIAAAAAAGVPDAVLTLSPTLVYTRELTLRAPITLQSATVPAGRMSRTPPLPSFRGGLIVEGAGPTTLVGIEVRHTNPGTDIVRLLGANVTLDRVRVLGDPVRGAKRCITSNTNGNGKVLRSYVADCFLPSPGQDSQAIGGFDMGPGLLVEDNYLEGGSETVLFGGADMPETRIPRDLVFRHNTITKNPAWYGQPIGVKNLVEFKAAINVLFEDNDCSYSWTQGQTGYLLVLTVRNQDGRAPWVTIQDAIFRNNTWRDGVAAINILGRDDIKEMLTGSGRVPIGTVRPSVPLARVRFENETFALDPLKYGKSTNDKAILIGGGPIDVSLNHVKITSASRLGAGVYFTSSGAPAKVSGLAFTDVTFPTSTYGMFGEVSSAAPTNWTATNPTWVRYVLNGTISGITITP